MLQKRGAPASGLLPQWLTGYEILLNAAFDRERAHQLVTEVSPGRPLTPVSLAYDFSDPVAKLVAERIAFDASQAGLTVRQYGETHVNSKSAQASINADALLLRLPLASSEPSVALAARAGDLGLDAETVSAILGATRPEDLLQAERKVLEDCRIIPVAHVSQALWLNAGTHNWQVLANGLWDLGQLWVEGGR
jgi:hypothetical protein